MKVHSSFIYNDPKLEITQISFKEWLVKQTGLYSYRGILLGNKEQIIWYVQQLRRIKIMFGEKSQSQKVTCFMVTLYNILKVTKF